MEKVFKHETFGEARISTVEGFAILTMDDIMVQQSDTDAFMKWICDEVLPEVNPNRYYTVIGNVSRVEPVNEKITRRDDEKKMYVKITEDKYLHIDGYFTIRDWCYNNNMETPGRTTAKNMGIKAMEISRKKGYIIYRIENEKYGTINAYHKNALEELTIKGRRVRIKQ
jgi:hypothetical protein